MTNQITLMYGTAWKEDSTRSLTILALQMGFRAIDTANQRKHYHEIEVGEGIREVLENSELKREDLFLQTKYTYMRGQDNRLPYDPKASITDQVEQSLASSLRHLHTDYLDSFLLHGPSRSDILGQDDYEAWAAMEAAKEEGLARAIGISNVSAHQLELLLQKARIKPAWVQNRCFARLHWDKEVRRICQREGIGYQGFSLLTANIMELRNPIISDLCSRHLCTLPQLVFRFAQQVGMTPLTGTSSQKHMAEDLRCTELQFSEEELSQIEEIAL